MLVRQKDLMNFSNLARILLLSHFSKFLTSCTETFITKTKKLYSDVRVNNLSKVTDGLNDVQKIMSRNITEILGRGEKLESE